MSIQDQIIRELEKAATSEGVERVRMACFTSATQRALPQDERQRRTNDCLIYWQLSPEPDVPCIGQQADKCKGTVDPQGTREDERVFSIAAGVSGVGWYN